jgi:L-amino acid N-acyltransferase YncA
MEIRPMPEDDRDAVLAIYAQGIEDRLATFETVFPPWEEWDRNHLEECRLVAESDGTLLGWEAIDPVSTSPSLFVGTCDLNELTLWGDP